MNTTYTISKNRKRTSGIPPQETPPIRGNSIIPTNSRKEPQEISENIIIGTMMHARENIQIINSGANILHGLGSF